ncbi:MAG: class II glutamine amidotransferase [Elusimicrobia bacterium]|nr:class II glutamine amidotransferase [Elusimicrobiota bacterium]
MCRLFGQLCIAPRTAEDLFAEDPYSLLSLSDADRKRPQKDGWGVGWFDADGRARVVKSARPVRAEEGRARAALRRARSRAVVGHIRAASNPLGLSARQLFGAVNNQPFSDGRWLFAHNGTLEVPDEVASHLGDGRRRLRGRNDSEVYFRQFLKFLDAYSDAGAALAACARETWRVWRASRARHPDKKRPFTGLNAVVTDGRELHALSLYRSARGLRSLGRGAQPWGTMSLRRSPGRVVVASEDSDRGRWRRLPPGSLVSVRRARGRLKVSVRRALVEAA